MNTWTAAKQQISKYGVTDLVNAGDLTIEHGALDTQMLGNPFREIREAAKHLSISGDQLSLAGVIIYLTDITQRAIMLHDPRAEAIA